MAEQQSQHLARRTLKGVAWAYGAFFGRRVFTFISTAVLARILVPADFGLIGFALLLLNFIEVTRGLGINDALIYNSERPEDTADTAFWINTGISAIQTALTIVFAPLSLYFFDDPRLVDVVRILSLSFLINGLGQTHNALLQKELLFQRRFLPDLLSSLIKGLLSIGLALAGAGVWSLVWGHIASAGVQTVILWIVIKWRPRLRFFTDRARSLWNYGVHILMFHVLSIALDQADQLVIGSLLGQVQLGYYTIASKIPELIIANFSLVLTTVLFPTYTKMKDDQAMLTRGFLLTTRYTVLITAGLGFGMAAVAPELVRVVYGRQWDPAVDLFRVLSFLGLAVTLPWATGDVLKAMGRPDIPTKLLFLEAIYTFPLIWIMGSQTRLAAMVSLGNLIAILITAVVRLGLMSRILKLNPIIYFEIFRAPLIGGGLLYGAVTLWHWVAEPLPALVVLVVSTLLGAAVYLVTLLVMDKDELFEALDLLLGMIRRRRGDEDSDEIPASPAPQGVDV